LIHGDELCTDDKQYQRLKHGRQNITLHWINGIIRNNKCSFTKLNAVFILKTAAWTKTYYNGINTVSYVVNFINFINITLIYHITKQRVCETVSII
jgi:UDP-2,3-diacylglucosamine pyrophosphatase LpxH